MDWDSEDIELSEEELITLVAEAEEELDGAEGVLLQMEAASDSFGRRAGDEERLDTLFRAMHTLKGNASSVGWEAMASLAHAAEDLMQGVRDGTIAPSGDVADLLLRTVDEMRSLTSALAEGGEMPAVSASLIRDMQSISDRASEEYAGDSRSDSDLFRGGGAPGTAVEGSALVVEIEVSEETDIPAVRALQAIMACEEMGSELVSDPSKDDIDAGAMEDGGRILCRISEPWERGEIAEALHEIEGVIHVRFGTSTGEDLAGESGAESEVDEGKSADAGIARSADTRQIRVDVSLMDRLMNQVVEMVITRNRLSSLIETLSDHGMRDLSEEMQATVEQMAGITTTLQEDIMQTRLVPLDSLFRRFPRMMRNLKKSSGKEFHFQTDGGDTEIDRSLLDAIGDPMIHLLRNAVDHGIEDPEVRRGAGKDPAGTIRLSAFRQENFIVVEVSDDGGGLDVEAIAARARARGLLDSDAERRMSEEDLLDLLFSPGFSTSESVTEISGRGVGLDVVRREVEDVNGTVIVENRPGRGSTFRLSLPLTVTTVRSLLVEIARQVYVIPLGSIRETIRLEAVDLHRTGDTPMLPFRGDFIPLFRLRDFFPDSSGAIAGGDEKYIVVLSMDRRDYGLLVDDLLGEEESVIKPLRRPIGNIPGLSSATIRPDGSVALILDANGLFKEMRRTARRAINE